MPRTIVPEVYSASLGLIEAEASRSAVAVVARGQEIALQEIKGRLGFEDLRLHRFDSHLMRLCQFG